MPGNVIDHERRDEIIAVVVLRLVAMRPQLAGTRKAYLSQLATVSLFITDDLVMRKITQRRPKISSS